MMIAPTSFSAQRRPENFGILCVEGSGPTFPVVSIEKLACRFSEYFLPFLPLQDKCSQSNTSTSAPSPNYPEEDEDLFVVPFGAVTVHRVKRFLESKWPEIESLWYRRPLCSNIASEENKILHQAEIKFLSNLSGSEVNSLMEAADFFAIQPLLNLCGARVASVWLSISDEKRLLVYQRFGCIKPDRNKRKLSANFAAPDPETESQIQLLETKRRRSIENKARRCQTVAWGPQA
eukprot:GHVP01036811.1.p1 GENE.GHVP01036811.1~~GHVP01036811.1.p1  ORF type:complete len:234 (-),score=35.49 GHVP01036811.1:1063-1764(-)